jgi:hypothetical protein
MLDEVNKVINEIAGDPEPKAVLDTLTMVELQEMLRKDGGTQEADRLIEDSREQTA